MVCAKQDRALVTFRRAMRRYEKRARGTREPALHMLRQPKNMNDAAWLRGRADTILRWGGRREVRLYALLYRLAADAVERYLKATV